MKWKSETVGQPFWELLLKTEERNAKMCSLGRFLKNEHILLAHFYVDEYALLEKQN